MGGFESSESYDSTWEEDEENVKGERSSAGSKEAIYHKTQQKFRNPPVTFNYKYKFSEAARDMRNYRHRYQPTDLNYQSTPDNMPNLMFYKNKIKFEPKGLYIDDLLRDWRDRYDILEENHDYIQWLFPVQERGRNPYASPLHGEEIKMMKKDEDVKRRLCKAYKLMLHFYGLQLLDEDSGKVGRAQNWKERYRNLDKNGHNNLRITRILKCLGELGYEHFQGPLIHFFLAETLCYGSLQNLKRSVLDFFVFSVRDKKERQRLLQYAWEHYEPKSQFIWGPVELLQKTRSKSTYNGGHNNVVESKEEICCSSCCSFNWKM